MIHAWTMRLRATMTRTPRPLMMAGPHVKRGYVSHTHANFGSVLRVVYHVLGLPPVNQFDLAASLLDDFFTDKPDPTPYTLERVDPRIFDPGAAMKVYDRSFDWRRFSGGPKLDDADEQREKHYEQIVPPRTNR